MKTVTLDPTDRDAQTLEIEENGKIERIQFAENFDAGTRLITEIKNLQLTAADQLRVVTGPGSYTSLRIAAAVANTTALVTSCQLFARKKAEKKWQKVTKILPAYGAEPQITLPKK